MPNKRSVSIVRFDARSDDREVVNAVIRSLNMLNDTLESFSGLRSVFVKTNIGLRELVLHEGRQVALTEVCVLRAAIKALREHTDSEILVDDTITEKGTTEELYTTMGYREALGEFDVRLIDVNDPPYIDTPVAGGGLIFSRYTINKIIAEPDKVRNWSLSSIVDWHHVFIAQDYQNFF